MTFNCYGYTLISVLCPLVARKSSILWRK